MREQCIFSTPKRDEGLTERLETKFSHYITQRYVLFGAPTEPDGVVETGDVTGGSL